MERKNEMPSFILQNIYMEVAREHASKSPVNSIYKERSKSNDLHGETLFSESSVSLINQYFIPTEVQTRADLKTYTITIEEEDSTEGFEALERLASQENYISPLSKSKKTESIEKEFPNTSPIPAEIKQGSSISQNTSPELKVQAKPAIKRPSKLKYTSNNKKVFERAMSLPTQNVTFASKERNILETHKKDDDVGEAQDDELYQSDTLMGFYSKNKRGSKSLARNIKGKLSQNKLQMRESRDNPGKSHFYFLSQSFSESNETPAKAKLNNTTYSHRGFENAENEEFIKSLYPSQINNESPLDSRLNSQLTTKRSSLVEDFKAFKKSVHPPSFNTSFEGDELFHKEATDENKQNIVRKNKPRIITSPEPEEFEQVGDGSKTPTKKQEESPKKVELIKNGKSSPSPLNKSSPKGFTNSLTPKGSSSSKSPKVIKQMKSDIEIPTQKGNTTPNSAQEKTKQINKPPQVKSSVTPKAPTSQKITFNQNAPKTPQNQKKISIPNISPKSSALDPRDRCKGEEKSTTQFDKNHSQSMALKRQKHSESSNSSLPSYRNRSNTGEMLIKGKAAPSPILKPKQFECDLGSYRTSPEKSLSKICPETENLKDANFESFLEETKHLEGVSEASLDVLHKIDTYVEIDPEYFEPYLGKAELVERQSPPRIYMKIIDKILEEEDSSSTTVQTSTKNSNTVTSPPELQRAGHSNQPMKGELSHKGSLQSQRELLTKKMSLNKSRPKSPSLYETPENLTPNKSDKSSPRIDARSNYDSASPSALERKVNNGFKSGEKSPFSSADKKKNNFIEKNKNRFGGDKTPTKASITPKQEKTPTNFINKNKEMLNKANKKDLRFSNASPVLKADPPVETMARTPKKDYRSSNASPFLHKEVYSPIKDHRASNATPMSKYNGDKTPKMYSSKTPTNKSGSQDFTRLYAKSQRNNNASPISKVERAETLESLIFSPKKDYRASNTTPISRIELPESELMYSPKKDSRADYSTIQRIDTQESEISNNYSLYRTLGNLTPTNPSLKGNNQSPSKNMSLYNKNPSISKKEKVPERNLNLEILNDSRSSPLVGGKSTPQKNVIHRGSPVLDRSKVKVNDTQLIQDKIESPSKGNVEVINGIPQQKKEVKVFQYRSLTGSLFNKSKGT